MRNRVGRRLRMLAFYIHKLANWVDPYPMKLIGALQFRDSRFQGKITNIS